jgi:hypothetical protein
MKPIQLSFAKKLKLKADVAKVASDLWRLDKN